MALIDCSECGKQISDKAPACPNCGAPLSMKVNAPSPSQKRTGNVSKTLGVLVLIGLIAILLWMWRSTTSNTAAPPSAGLAAALRQPQVIVNERVQLKEGQSMLYSFTLRSDARVQAQVTASPKQVDVMLMDSSQAAKFREVNGKLFGGQYTYKQALSGEHVLNMDKTEVLPQGSWVIVVMRPREALLFTEETAVQTVVTAY